MEPKEELKSLVKEVKKRDKKITQEAMAERLGMSRAYLSELLGKQTEKRGKVEPYHVSDFKKEFAKELSNTASTIDSEDLDKPLTKNDGSALFLELMKRLDRMEENIHSSLNSSAQINQVNNSLAQTVLLQMAKKEAQSVDSVDPDKLFESYLTSAKSLLKKNYGNTGKSVAASKRLTS